MQGTPWTCLGVICALAWCCVVGCDERATAEDTPDSARVDITTVSDTEQGTADISGPDNTIDAVMDTALECCSDIGIDYLKASRTSRGDRFGFAVAVDGDTVVVGATGEDSSATGLNGDEADNDAQNSGAVYVFVRDSSGEWRQRAYLKASNSDHGDRFGASVAISGDTLVVGAPGEASDAAGIGGDQAGFLGPESGAVYVFVRDSAGSWTQQAYIKASNADINDRFGQVVDLSGDTLAVGAPGEDSRSRGVNRDGANNEEASSGAAYIFSRNDQGTWRQAAYLKAPFPNLDDLFGKSLALDGDTLVVGARGESSAATGINPQPRGGVAGASGALFVFERDERTEQWQQRAFLKAGRSEPELNFGEFVALDGDTLVVTAPGERDEGDAESPPGVVYIVARDAAGGWTEQARLSQSGAGTMDSADTQDHIFGSALAIDNNILAVTRGLSATDRQGTRSDLVDGRGVVSLFVRDGSGRWIKHADLVAPNAETNDRFGHHLALSGNTLVVGTPHEDSNSSGTNGDQVNNGALESGAAFVHTLIP